MRENTVKSIWKRGGAAADLQHGLFDYQTAVSLFQAVAATPTIPLAHVPWNEPGVIMKLLDAGAFAKAAVGAMREDNVTGAKRAGGSMY